MVGQAAGVNGIISIILLKPPFILLSRIFTHVDELLDMGLHLEETQLRQRIQQVWIKSQLSIENIERVTLCTQTRVLSFLGDFNKNHFFLHDEYFSQSDFTSLRLQKKNGKKNDIVHL